jgi:hypothetical protein
MDHSTYLADCKLSGTILVAIRDAEKRLCEITLMATVTIDGPPIFGARIPLMRYIIARRLLSCHRHLLSPVLQ